MKKILIILIISLLSINAKAEYNGYHVMFSIETYNNEIHTAYAYLAPTNLNLDSLNNKNYLQKRLDQSWKENYLKDSLTYFLERVKYDYKRHEGLSDNIYSIYSLNSKASISFDDIKSIQVIDFIEQTYAVNISSPITLADSIWYKNDPIKSYSFGGYLCFYQVYVHSDSKKVDQIIQRLLEKQKQLIELEENDEMEIDLKNGDEIDNEFYEIIKELNSEKVVVISECTC